MEPNTGVFGKIIKGLLLLHIYSIVTIMADMIEWGSQLHGGIRAITIDSKHNIRSKGHANTVTEIQNTD